MRARYYSPELKKFINADVVKGEIGKSNTLNRYAYVEGNPATLIDPFGLSAEPGTKSNKSSFNWSEGIHTALDAGGFIPGLGNICDGANALYYLIQGDFGNAGLSAISIIPFGDYFAKGGKYAVKIGSNVVEAGVKYGDDVVKSAHNVAQFEKLRAFYAADEIINAERISTALSKSDPAHLSASFLTKEQLAAGKVTSFKGGDGIKRILLQTKGELNGQSGIFEYILTPEGKVSHQRFIKGGIYTGYPNQVVPKGGY